LRLLWGLTRRGRPNDGPSTARSTVRAR
jgi:hypothetical protein